MSLIRYKEKLPYKQLLQNKLYDNNFLSVLLLLK